MTLTFKIQDLSFDILFSMFIKKKTISRTQDPTGHVYTCAFLISGGFRNTMSARQGAVISILLQQTRFLEPGSIYHPFLIFDGKRVSSNQFSSFQIEIKRCFGIFSEDLCIHLFMDNLGRSCAFFDLFAERVTLLNEVMNFQCKREDFFLSSGFAFNREGDLLCNNYLNIFCSCKHISKMRTIYLEYEIIICEEDTDYAWLWVQVTVIRRCYLLDLI